MVSYVGPEPERHFYFGEFPKMETFSRNIDLCLSSQRCVFHPAMNMGPKLQGTTHSESAHQLSPEKGYVQASQRSQLREKHLCFGKCSASTENGALCPPNFQWIFIR